MEIMEMDEAITKALEERLGKLERLYGGISLSIPPSAYQHEIYRAVDFTLNARVVKCSVHVMSVDGEDGPEPGIYYKTKLRAKLDGTIVNRTIAITADPLGQILRSFGKFDEKILHTIVHGHDTEGGIHGIIPSKVWEDLGIQLAEKRLQLDRDETAQRNFRKRLQALKDQIFAKDRDGFLHEVARLQRRGWKLPDVMECWNEALVKGVMES